MLRDLIRQAEAWRAKVRWTGWGKNGDRRVEVKVGDDWITADPSITPALLEARELLDRLLDAAVDPNRSDSPRVRPDAKRSPEFRSLS